MTKRVAIYTRVSTNDGKQTTENQLRDLHMMAERMGWTVVAHFTDEGISGARGREKRPGLDALLKAIARRECDMVAAWSVCRLGRSLQHLITMLGDLDARGVDLYARLFRKPGHVAATLGMMANWDLDALGGKMARLHVPVTLIAAAGDKAVSPGDVSDVARRIRSVRVITLGRGGHLVHEERPQEIAALIGAAFASPASGSRPQTDRLSNQRD